MTQRVWLDGRTAACYFAAPTRTDAKRFLADEYGEPLVDIRVHAVREDGGRAGRGHRGPYAEFDGEPGWMTHEEIMAAMPTLRWCEGCEGYWPQGVECGHDDARQAGIAAGEGAK